MAFLRRIPIARRFWKFVEKGTACWVWTGARSEWGYGRVSIATSKAAGAHRVSWELCRGPIPDGLHVLHRCDNPPCVNPDHLFLGTPADNAADKMAKGRARPAPPRLGEANHSARFTETDIIDIRTLRRFGATVRTLAESYGVRRTHIQQILRKDIWPHLP